MVKQKVKQNRPAQNRPARHHWFLVSIFVIIIVLALVAFILQRSTNIEAIAGEAIRQRIVETKQLAWSDEAAKIALAVQKGQETVFLQCPPKLSYNEQHWKIPTGWNLLPWKAVDAQCPGGDRIFCYYADGSSEVRRADQLIIYNDFPEVHDCTPYPGGPFPGCNCAIK